MDSDPDPARTQAELDAVRRELGRLGADDASAPPVPAHVTARVGAALRSAAPPRPARRRAALAVGLCAAAAILGAVALTRGTGSPPGTATFPLPDAQLRAALDVPADFGPLAAPERLASCLTGLGYPPDQEVLGARPLQLARHPAVLLLFPSDSAQVRAVIVETTCTAAAPGVLGDRTVARR